MEAFIFECAPCVPAMKPQDTTMVTLTTVLLLFLCHLFPLLAIRVLNFPLCCCPLPCTPSLLFRQRAAALPSSCHFIDPPALFYVLPCFLRLLKISESLPYILPCLSNLKTTVSSIGVFVYSFSHLFIFVFIVCVSVKMVYIVSFHPL